MGGEFPMLLPPISVDRMIVTGLAMGAAGGGGGGGGGSMELL